MRIATYIFAIFVGLLLLAAATVGLAVAFAWPKLPTLEALTDYRPRIPLRVFTSDGQLIGEFGEERRTFAKIQEVPAYMKNAILAAEDDRFYEHGGIDVAGFARAAVANLTSGGKRQGASTITMQVARNFFLTREKSYSRKLYEILLSIKIEKNLSKDQILELYFNQIYLGQRAYGFAAAAQIYYGKNLAQLNVAEAAMLAGLPKAPSAYNPISNPTRATQRQHYVLRRMRELNYIDAAQYEQALKTPLKVVRGGAESYPVHGEYVAEMARQMAVEQFKDAAYTAGIRVITTIKASDQEAAYNSLRRGLLDYERRHAYRGAEAYVDMSAVRSDADEQLDVLLEDFPDNGEMVPAILLEANAKRIRAYRRGGEVLEFTGPALRFVAPMLADNAAPAKRLRRGAVVRVAEGAKGWEIVQVPEVEGAFVAVEPTTGAVRALAGGFDFNRNKFNHVTQAWRQPGSSFKPFIYSAALEKGYSPRVDRARRPDQLPGVGDRQPGVGAEELRRQVRGADAPAHRPHQVEEHGLDPPAQLDRAAIRAGLRRPLRFRSGEASGLSDDGARSRVGNPMADGAGVLRVRERRLPCAAVHRQGNAGQPRPRAGADSDHQCRRRCAACD